MYQKNNSLLMAHLLSCTILFFNIFSSFALRGVRMASPVNKRRIIVDADVGTDDAFALLALLDADKQGLIKVEAIVCSNGNANVFNTCRNLLRILEILKRTDIPVYKGTINPIIKTNEKLGDFHGKDGLGDLHWDTEPDWNLLRKEPAAIAIQNIVDQNPQKITLVCLAPLTDPALSLKVYPNLTSNIRDMFIMGGNYLGIGNIRDMAEFNFFVDPEAAYIILNETTSPITLLPWEACLDTTITMDWRFNVLGKYHSTFMDLLNRVERKMYSGEPLNSTWITCDTILALTLLHPNIVVEEEKIDFTVELHGSLTRGEGVVRRHEEYPKIVLIEKVDSNKMKEKLIEIAKKIYEK